MRRTRAIPVLLISHGQMYKTVKFKNPSYIGDPLNAIRLFNNLGVDEIIILDIDASKEGNSPDIHLIKDLTSEAFMPFAYGGGISSFSDAKKIFECGVEKIVLNYSILENLNLVEECAASFGSQSVVTSIDYKNKLFNNNLQFNHVTSKTSNLKVLDVAIAAENAGSGEILINSVDRDGMMSGLDLETIQDVSSNIRVPLVACGGVGNLNHMKEAEEAGVSAIAAGSFFIYRGKHRGILINYPNEQELCQYLN